MPKEGRETLTPLVGLPGLIEASIALWGVDAQVHAVADAVVLTASRGRAIVRRVPGRHGMAVWSLSHDAAPHRAPAVDEHPGVPALLRALRAWLDADFRPGPAVIGRRPRRDGDSTGDGW